MAKESTTFDIDSYLPAVAGSLEKYNVENANMMQLLGTAKMAVMHNPSVKDFIDKNGPESFFNAMTYAVAGGLSLNPQEGLACLVPRYDKSAKKEILCYQKMANGLKLTAMKTGKVEWIRIKTVKENDTFEQPLTPDDTVKYAVALKNRGAVIGFFADMKLKSGSYVFEFMNVEDMKDHREKYSKNSFLSEIEYGEKTIARKLLAKNMIEPKEQDISEPYHNTNTPIKNNTTAEKVLDKVKSANKMDSPAIEVEAHIEL